jgi:hypothetical protein
MLEQYHSSFLSFLSSMRSNILSDLDREDPPLFSLVFSCWKLCFQRVVHPQGKNLVHSLGRLETTRGRQASSIQNK